MEATRPEFVRSAVENFTCGQCPATYEPPEPKSGRCEYWKVPLSPRALRVIDTWAEHLSTDSVKVNRQKLVNLAIRSLLQSYV